MLRYKSNDTITFFAKSTGEDNNVSISQVTSPGNGRKKVCIKYHNSTTSYGLTTDVTASQYSPKIKMNGSEYYFGKLNSSFLSTYTLTTTVTISNITNSTLNYTSISNITYTVDDDWGHYNSDYCSSFTTTEKIKFNFGEKETFIIYSSKSSTYNFDYITSTYKDYIDNALNTGIIRTFMDSRAYVISAADNKEDILYYVSEDVTCELLNKSSASNYYYDTGFYSETTTIRRFFSTTGMYYDSDAGYNKSTIFGNYTVTSYKSYHHYMTSTKDGLPLFIETTMSHSNLLFPRMVLTIDYENGMRNYFNRVLSNTATYYKNYDKNTSIFIYPELFFKYEGCVKYYNSLYYYTNSNSSYSNSILINTYNNYMGYTCTSYNNEYISPIVNTSFSYNSTLAATTGIDYITDFYNTIKISDIPEILDFSSSSHVNIGSTNTYYYSSRTTGNLDCVIEYDITKSDFVITKYRNSYKTKTINEMTTGYTNVSYHTRDYYYGNIGYITKTINRYTNITTSYNTFSFHTIVSIDNYDCFTYSNYNSSDIYSITPNTKSSTTYAINKESISYASTIRYYTSVFMFKVDSVLSKITSITTWVNAPSGYRTATTSEKFYKKEPVYYLDSTYTINESDFISLHPNAISHKATQPYISDYIMYEETYTNIHTVLQRLYNYSVDDNYIENYNKITNAVSSFMAYSSLLIGTYSSYKNTKNITIFEDNYVTDKVLYFSCQRFDSKFNDTSNYSSSNGVQYSRYGTYRNIDNNITVSSNIFGLYDANDSILINKAYMRTTGYYGTEYVSSSFSYRGNDVSLQINTTATYYSMNDVSHYIYITYAEIINQAYAYTSNYNYSSRTIYEYNNEYAAGLSSRTVNINTLAIITSTTLPYISNYIDPNINV